jgi:uncharacterized protein (DUF2062 family)
LKFNKDIFKKIKKEVFNPEESSFKKAISIGFGSFMAFTPIWGFQMLASLPFILFFRLNKILVLIFVNASIAPLLPLIIYCSFKVGGFFITSNQVDLLDWQAYTIETIQLNVVQYTVGSLILASIIGTIAFFMSFAISKMTRKNEPI